MLRSNTYTFRVGEFFDTNFQFNIPKFIVHFGRSLTITVVSVPVEYGKSSGCWKPIFLDYLNIYSCYMNHLQHSYFGHSKNE